MMVKTGTSMKLASILLLALLVAPESMAANAARAITDVDILQFALNLEYLEANFYSCAVYGIPIPSNLTGGGPTPTGCTKALLSPEALVLAADIAADEIAHVSFLKSALGLFKASPVAQPQIDLATSFVTAGNAAFGTTLSPSFSPYGSDILFYLGSYIFEDVGATAYLGALPSITSPLVIGAAGAILAVEGYHAAAIRTKLYESIDVTLFPYGVTTGVIVGKISALRDAAGGTKIDVGLQVPAKPGGALSLVPVDKNALLSPRTPAQVLSIVTLGGAGNKGGFFPNGLNGYIS